MEDTFFFFMSILILFIIIEFLASQAFIPFFYSLGIPVYNKTIECKTANFNANFKHTIYMNEGRFKFLSNKKVLFVSKLNYKFFKFYTPFPFKATATIKPDNKIDISAKMPLFPVLFIILFFFVFAEEITMLKFEFFISMLIFIVLFFVFGYFVEKINMMIKIKELRQIITDPEKYRQDDIE